MMSQPQMEYGLLWICFFLCLVPATILARPSIQGNNASPFFLRNRQLSDNADSGMPYHLWSSHEIRDALMSWAIDYPDLVRVTTSQAAYGLSSAGGSGDCPFDEGDGCLNYILTIQDYTVHPEDSDSSNALPEVLWSGSLHGNERVGPTATMEAASLLLQAASCEAKPNKAIQHHVGHAIHEGMTWENELASAKSCRKALEEQKYISTEQRQWLARLVTTRRIVVVPTGNALGYFRNVREEHGIDPNRDFPYDVTDPTQCMQTIAGRTFNELFRQHMFQLALTFHGGTEVVAYEWGAPTYLNYLSPDDQAQDQIAAAYSRYGGGWTQSKPYDYGTMNDKVYFVRGGMEDWAYAGSWDPDRVIQCRPKGNGGYAAEKTVYNNSTLRAFNMLVETSNDKEPASNSLGSSLDVLDKDTSGNGHVSRNVRLALLAADLVEPYVSVVAVNELTLSDDILPLTERTDRTTCQRTKAVMIPRNGKVTVEWTVGGGMHIDETSVWYGKWNDDVSNEISCMSQPQGDISKVLKWQGTSQNVLNGTGFFSDNGAYPSKAKTMGPVFSATLDVSQFQTGDQLVVLARARLDSNWQSQPDNVGPSNAGAQSHVVNARTNPNWHHESEGKVIQGRLDWYSTIPLTMVIGDFSDNVGSQGGRVVGTIELSNRFGHSTGTTKGGMSPTSSTTKANDNDWKKWMGVTVLILTCAVVLILCRRYRRQVKHQRILNELLDDEDEFDGSQRPYSDDVEGDFDDHDLQFDEDDGVRVEHGEHDGDMELRTFTID